MAIVTATIYYGMALERATQPLDLKEWLVLVFAGNHCKFLCCPMVILNFDVI